MFRWCAQDPVFTASSNLTKTVRAARTTQAPAFTPYWEANIRERHHKAFLRLIAYFAAVCVASTITCAANRPGFDFLDHVIDEEVYEEVAETLSLSEPQLRVADRAFEAYWSAVKSLEDAAQSEFQQLGPRFDELNQRYEEYPGGVDAFCRAEASLQTDVNAIAARVTRRADHAMNEFFETLRPVLSEEQKQRVARVRMLIVRRNFFAPLPPEFSESLADFEQVVCGV